jgi:hypothetical protein
MRVRRHPQRFPAFSDAAGNPPAAPDQAARLVVTAPDIAWISGRNGIAALEYSRRTRGCQASVIRPRCPPKAGLNASRVCGDEGDDLGGEASAGVLLQEMAGAGQHRVLDPGGAGDRALQDRRHRAR